MNGQGQNGSIQLFGNGDGTREAEGQLRFSLNYRWFGVAGEDGSCARCTSYASADCCAFAATCDGADNGAERRPSRHFGSIFSSAGRSGAANGIRLYLNLLVVRCVDLLQGERELRYSGQASGLLCIHNGA